MSANSHTLAVVPLRVAGDDEPESLLSLLLACHERIRKFTRLALTLGVKTDLPAEEVRCNAAHCLHYFTEALALHVRDEEESLWPRLEGHDPSLDATMAQMRAQHFAHVARLDALTAALRAVFHQPGEAVAHRLLAAAASTLEADFEDHLALEEQEIFPYLGRVLSADEREAIVDEVRARRREGIRSGRC